VSTWPLGCRATRRTLGPALLLLVLSIGLQAVPFHLQGLVDHLPEGVAGVTREGHLEARTQTLLEEVHLLLLSVGLIWSIPHGAGETSGILLYLLSALGDVAELLHLGVHDTLRYMLLTERLSELSPGYAPRVLVGVTVAVPPCACSASELVSGNSHTLLISASGEVQLLLDLTQPVFGGNGIIISTVKRRRPQLEEAF
jgi:hypothetical protein